MRGASFVLAVASALTLLPTPRAAADEVDQVAHEMAVTFREDHARVVVTRTVQTDLDQSMEAHLPIRAAGPMVAADLRTQDSEGRWHRGELMPVDDAVETYWKLTGSSKVVPSVELGPRSPSFAPKDPALLMWTPTGLDLFVFPVEYGVPKTVEYTLRIPYRYEGGARTARLPVGDASDLAPKVTVVGTPAHRTVLVDGSPVTRGSVVTDTSTDGLLVQLPRTGGPSLAVRVASTPAGERHLARISVEAAAALGPDPAGTRAIVIVDRSKSMGDTMIAAQPLVSAYLDALDDVPRARVDIVDFHRQVHEQHGAFVSPATAKTAWSRRSLELHNGSELPAALAVAAARLRNVGRRVPKRVIVVTDARLGPTAEAEIDDALAGTGAVVHLVDLQRSHYTAHDVDEAHRLAAVVRATGGVTWRTGLDDDGRDIDAVAASWVRPTMLRGVTIAVNSAEVYDDSIAAGEGQLQVAVYDHAPEVRVSGSLWGVAVSANGTRSAARDRAWSQLAPAYIDAALSPAEMVEVATRGHAVSPATALLALEPRVSPGQAVETPAATTNRVRRTVCRMRWGRASLVGRFTVDYDEAAALRDAVRTAATGCGAEGAVEVGLTTTSGEVVEIGRIAASGGAKREACIRTSLWALDLLPGKDAVTTHTIRLD